MPRFEGCYSGYDIRDLNIALHGLLGKYPATSPEMGWMGRISGQNPLGVTGRLGSGQELPQP